jgi:hypothetical protein
MYFQIKYAFRCNLTVSKRYPYTVYRYLIMQYYDNDIYLFMHVFIDQKKIDICEHTENVAT